MASAWRRSGLLAGLVAGSAWLSGCATQAGIPLLYADPGVRIERPTKGDVPYQPGMALEVGDFVQTAGASAVIDFDDDNVVALRENTRIQLGSIKLFFGEVFARLGKVVERGGGQVTTDELSASVTGTEYSVRRDPVARRPDIGNTAVVVRQGTVTCQDHDRLRPPVSVSPNFLFRIEGRQPPRPLQSVDARALTAWADLVIQRLLQPRPQMSTPPIQFGIGVGIPFSTGSRPPRDRGMPEHHEQPPTKPPTQPTAPPPRQAPAPPSSLQTPKSTAPWSTPVVR
jgi:FecR protein